MTDWTGQTLFGRWTVERLIGVGGTSTVLQARHRNGRRAALKILHPHLAAHGRMRERFLREGKLANLVDHPGVVAVLDDFVTDDGTAILVLELVQGQTLAELAKEAGGVLEPREVLTAARAVLEVLAAAHDANVIHRDIKPENILRRTNGSYKLADFGLAALCHELGMLTGTNAALGTPAYMSPEQARGDVRDVDARTDIWAVGATMFTLLTGRYLHASSAPRNLVVATATEEARPVLSMEPGMYPPLAVLIDRAVRMKREERWPNARAMLAELETIIPVSSEIRALTPTVQANEAAMSTAPSSLMSWSHAVTWLRRGELRFRRRLAGIALGAVTAAAGVALFWAREPAPPPSDDAASGSRLGGALQPESSGASLLPSPSKAPTVPSPEAAHPRNDPTPPKRPLTQQAARPTHVASKPKVAAPVGAPVEKNEPGLSVPDEVLDRRE